MDETIIANQRMEPTLANAQFSCLTYKTARLTRNVRRGKIIVTEQTRNTEQLPTRSTENTGLNS